MKRTLGNVLRGIRMAGVGMGLAGLLFSTKACTPAQQKVVAGEVIIEEAKTPEEMMAGYLLKTVGLMEQEIEVAEAGADRHEININIESAAAGERSTRYENVVYVRKNTYRPASGFRWANPEDPNDYGVVAVSNNYLKNLAPAGLHAYNNWNDLDGDGVVEKDEFFGFDKKVFNLKEEYMKVYFIPENQDKSTIVTFRSWIETGKLIGETTDHIPPKRFHRRWTGLDSEYASPKDFIDKIRDSGPGKYVITANVDGGNSTYRIEVEITE